MDAETATTAETLALVKMMVLALVDHPDQVKIDAESSQDCITIHVSTNPLDTGKVVGKMGRTARSLRTILGGHSRRVGQRFILDIAETPRIFAAPNFATPPPKEPPNVFSHESPARRPLDPRPAQ